MARLAERWPNAKRIVVGAHPRPGAVKLDFHFPKPDTPADMARAVTLSLRLAHSDAEAGAILVIDDSRSMRALAILHLERGGRPALGADGVEAALGLIETYRFSAVVMDLFMAGMGGIAGIQLLRTRAPHLAIVAMSGGLDARMGKEDALTAAVKIGADHSLSKPFQP
jgi:CheY-like chemotaxis protein